ncbi:hypothetical protein [Sporosarcina sp. 6E9]|uniref:hypothetical protein n=1 Tax=Sporosarcina sp. 6E9 TaxID=2819235 RepID=UPI001B3018FC|nr:hypothetical protein [Sporosarcina sp. 6E9]
MKLIQSAFIAFSIALVASGCSHHYGTKVGAADDVQQLIDDQQTGFVIITNETDAPFLEEVQKALLEKKEDALQFNVFYNDGKNKNADGLSKNPFRFEMPHVNTVYYIKDGKAFGEYDLEAYEGLRQQEELHHFIDSMPNHKGDTNEQ